MSRSDEPASPSTSEPPGELPLFPLNTVLFPGGPLALRIFEPRYVNLVRRCTGEGCPFGVVLIREGAEAGAPVTNTADIGTSARIVDFNTLPDGLLGILCIGDRRFRLRGRWQQADKLNIGEVEWLPDEPAVAVPDEYAHLVNAVRRATEELGELYRKVPRHFDDASWIGYRLAELLPLSVDDKQTFLEMTDPLARLARLAAALPR